MSWASRRRSAYLTGIFLLVICAIAFPLMLWLYEPSTCFDGVQNQSETAPDQGGPCRLLDARTLIPHAVLWTRGFQVRVPEEARGVWSAVAYVENPNKDAGVMQAPYRFRLYDPDNVLITDREGVAYVMPGSVTPVYEGAIPTGNRRVGRTFFEFTAPLVWERMQNTVERVRVSGKTITDVETAPRVEAIAENLTAEDFPDVEFVVVVFDPAGTAIASSRTIVPLLTSGEREQLVFTWPQPFGAQAGRIDVIPRRAPAYHPSEQ